MDVLITEASTGNLITRYSIILGGQNYTPSAQEYFNEAWRCAVDDNLVRSDRRAEYGFNLGSY